MQTIDANTPASTPVTTHISASFESCAEFRGANGTPVCDACGWLEHEHAPLTAEVLALPARRVARNVPKRLAS